MNKSERVFILKKVKYSEADLVLSCLSRQGARLNFLAKSALKSKKRFSGGILEPTHYVELLYRENFGEEPIHYLQEAKLIDGFESIRSDYSRIELSLYFLKLMNKVSLGGEVHNENNFNLLGNSLN